jgi:hypothetical protein
MHQMAKPYKTTDARSKPSRFSGAPEPQRVNRARANGDLAARKALHRTSEERQQYSDKARPRIEREKTTRE